MANIATNEVMVVFKQPNISLKEKQKVIDYIRLNLVHDSEFYNEPDLEYNTVLLSYGTKWDEGIKILEKICKQFNVNIIGVCYEWGNAYVNSFNL